MTIINLYNNYFVGVSTAFTLNWICFHQIQNKSSIQHFTCWYHNSIARNNNYLYKNGLICPSKSHTEGTVLQSINQKLCWYPWTPPHVWQTHPNSVPVDNCRWNLLKRSIPRTWFDIIIILHNHHYVNKSRDQEHRLKKKLKKLHKVPCPCSV